MAMIASGNPSGSTRRSHISDRTAGTSAGRLTSPAMRWLAIAATIALLLVTAAGAYWGLVRTSGNDDPSTAVAVIASPVATPVSPAVEIFDQCQDLPAYVACRQNTIIGDGPIGSEVFSETLINGQNISVFRWNLGSEETDTTSVDSSDHNGVAIDMIERGAYVAAFTEDVVISRGDVSGVGDQTTFYYLEPGETVELSSGDAVVYPIGSRSSVMNPFNMADSRLYGVTIVVSEQEMITLPQMSAATLLGTSQLEQPLIEYIRIPGESTALFRLTYAQVPPGAPIENPIKRQLLAWGPVYATPGNPEGAYLLWIRFPRG